MRVDSAKDTGAPLPGARRLPCDEEARHREGDLLGVEDDVLADGMQRLGFRYAVSFNARHRRRGRIFGAPYSLRRVSDDADLLGVYRYVMLNPVEAGLVERPEEWPWSSYGSTVGLRDTFSFVNAGRVLGCLGGTPEIAVARLRAFVERDLPVSVRRHADAPVGDATSR